MTAKPEPQAIPARSPSPLRARRPDRLRRQLLVERAFFIAVIVVLAIVAVRQARALRAYQITVDGRPVVTVADRGTAKKLLAELSGDMPDARFRQTVDVQRADLRAGVAREERARKVLATAIHVIVPAHVIIVNGKVAAAVPSREDAEQVLSRVRATYAGPDQKSRFKESVRVEAADISRGRVVAAEDAFKLLAGGAAGSTTTYEVQAGDTAWSIAKKHGISVEQLGSLNSRINLDRLQAGQTLSVGHGKSGLTVVTVEERTEIEPIPSSTSVKAAPDLRKGERRVITKGQDGEKSVRYRITSENGRVVKREVVAETVTRRPKPERVLVGTGA